MSSDYLFITYWIHLILPFTNYYLFSDCIIAPYEADAQLAFLVKSGIVDMIITEDSDLTLFGCDKVLFKLEHQSGNGVLVWGILQIRGDFDKKSSELKVSKLFLLTSVTNLTRLAIFDRTWVAEVVRIPWLSCSKDRGLRITFCKIILFWSWST